MARFEDSIDYILAHEGGYVDHPSDPGGATFFGISLRFLKATGTDIDGDGDIDAADVSALTMAQVHDLYRSEFWDRVKLDKIESQPLATKIMDMIVNMGIRQGVKLAQRSCKALGEPLRIDGKLGPKTRSALNGGDPVAILDGIRDEAAKFYQSLAEKRPELEVFLKGWLRRAAA